jgi:hypothetical protein
MSFGSNRLDRVRSLQKFPVQLHLVNLCVNGTSSARFALTFMEYRNGPKRPQHEFWVQCSGSCAFLAKSSDATSLTELVSQWHKFGCFCTDFHAAMKPSETPQNMSFGSNGVDRVGTLRKIPTQLHLANLCINGTISVHFAPTFTLY